MYLAVEVELERQERSAKLVTLVLTVYQAGAVWMGLQGSEAIQGDQGSLDPRVH